VHDAATNDDLRSVGALLLEREELALAAGCAGFAAVLLDLLGLAAEEQTKPPSPREIGPLLVVGGSVNALSLRQLNCAVQGGFARLVPPPELKLNPNADREPFVSEAAAFLCNGRDIILQSVRGAEDDAACNRYADAHRVPREEIPRRIPRALALLAREILVRAEAGALVIFGGDTAIAVMRALGVSRILPEGEPLPGVVRSRIVLPGGELTLITKSGGFGNEDVLLQLKG
jgi:uncharacterized protein YgbK (DUF1537 family)